MIDIYWLTLGALSAICAAILYFKSSVVTSDDSARESARDTRFASWQWRWLVVYYVAMASDWLQGPYVYALYERCFPGEPGKIATLFIMGFMSSAVVGTFAGSLADGVGRKRMCQVFCLLYIVSCLTKLSCSYGVLMFGRLTGGTATSLLFSVFESWMVDEHRAMGFREAWLGQTFSKAVVGNGLVAIVTGVVAQLAVKVTSPDVENPVYVAPFLISAALNVLCLVLLMPWNENYGDSKISLGPTLRNALHTLRSEPRIALLGLVQSLFESSMYTFVFMWTPALASSIGGDGQAGGIIPHGLIFASFMVCTMIGSSLYSIVPDPHNLQFALVVATVALAVPVWATSRAVILASFFLFEVVCGFWWPSIGTLRGRTIPEETRSAIMNIFRVPLNLLVVGLLTNLESMASSTVFMMCALWMGLAVVLLRIFLSTAATTPAEARDGGLSAH